MINFLIFSKDRACQLDLLLRSITEYCQFPHKTTILYTYSDVCKASYELCRFKHAKCNWVKETNFEEQVKKLIQDEICLLTDDTIFFRKFNIKKSLEKNEVFSFRLGYNTYIQDHVSKREQPQLIPDGETDDGLWWNPNKYPEWCNYGYPFSFDGHVYPTGLLYDILKDKQFKNTNEIEGILHSQRKLVTRLYSDFNSSCVNVPVNNLSGLTASGKFFNYTTSYLNHMFTSGKRVKLLRQYSNVPIIGCHQELEFEFYDI